MTIGEEPAAPVRRGLSKLRGETESAPETQAAPAAHVAGPETTAQRDEQKPPAGGVVTLTKPDQETAAPPAAADPEPSASPRRRPAKKLVAALIALVAGIAVLLALVIVNSDRLSDPKKPAAAATSGGTADQRLVAIRAARQFTVSFFTYDYRQIEAYFKRIEAASTGAFRADFVSKEKTLKTVVAQLKTVATGQVPDTGAGLSTLNATQATALVAANFNASNAVTKNGQKRYRIKITMQLVKGNWLVSNLDEVI